MRIAHCCNFIMRGPEVWGKISTKSFGHNIHEALKRNVDSREPAILDVTTKKAKSFGELLTETVQLASWLRAANCRKDDVISVCAENSVDFFTPIIAALYEGVTTTTINHTFTEAEIRTLLALVKPKVAFCSAAVYDKFAALQRRCEIPFVEEVVVLEQVPQKMATLASSSVYEPIPVIDTAQHTALILFSSGTTGLPKGVMLSHHNLNVRQNQAEDPNLSLSYMDEDTVVHLPFYHAFGLMLGISRISKGKTLRLLPTFSEEHFLSALQEYRVRRLVTVPPLVVLLAKSPAVDAYDLSALREILSGAAPLRRELEEQLQRRLPNVTRLSQSYGQTEVTLAVLTQDAASAPRAGSSGRVTPGHEVAVRDPRTGDFLGPLVAGEICVRGPLVMQGYFENAEATEATFTADGWLRTGDVAYYDADGFFYVVDRLKELIKYKGFQVAPAELEALLLEHAAVRDAGVVGLPDERRGELPVAFVVRKPGADVSTAEILAFVEGRVARSKRLHFVKFIDAIPKTRSGKLLRRELKSIVHTVTN